MKIKRYIVKDMKEALSVIKEDLGLNAVIISSQKVRVKGLKGFFMSKRLEVTAAVDEEDINEMKRKRDKEEEIKAEENKTEENKIATRENQNTSSEAFTTEEIEYLKKLLKKEKEEKTTLYQESKTKKHLHEENQVKTQAEELRKDNSQLELLRKKFRELELEEEIINIILKNYQEQAGKTEEIDRDLLVQIIAKILKPIKPEDQKSNVLAFVGPPGVGKTTTLAKLGAHFSLLDNVDISLITIDTYRIGAVQQLQTYGEIMNVSVDVVFSPEELREMVEKNKNKDIILIDTAGRPSKKTDQIREVKSYLEALDSLETYLVLSSVTKDKDLLRMVDDYKILDYSKLIFTKTDETHVLGSIINAAYKTQLPIAYITNGQNVPDDIEVGEPETLAKLILEGASL